MGKLTVLFLILIFFVSCKETKTKIPTENTANEKIDKLPEIDTTDNKAVFQIQDFKANFKFGKITSFNRDFVNKEVYSGQNKGFIKIKAKDFQTIFQNSKIDFGMGASGGYYDPIYYSIQNTKGYQAITVIGIDDDWTNKVCLLTYNLKGMLMGAAYLYEKGGDGGYWTDAWGKFINDSIYYKTSLRCEPDEKDDNFCYIDSINSIIQIGNNGLVNEKMLDKNRLHKRMPLPNQMDGSATSK